ncbi:hypothetical protein A5698_03500 [Mycobacterium sp. E136]|uniref:hypothetical protein n=1 Tax=Mycobacterium sp. E136 TaxID=1834125 RepID=UPI00080224CB|nr:hypothetical protein [Mycobacterium sp. E136]OBG85905.1 hypothetical protein A5698_03500 [Mycobacterium sp. E136]
METFKRYLMFQGMMFVFGIVGPIFLIMYFASQPDPTVRWAYWIGLFITTADVLIALGLTASTQTNEKSGVAVKLLERGERD